MIVGVVGAASHIADKTSVPEGSFWGLTGGIKGSTVCCGN